MNDPSVVAAGAGAFAGALAATLAGPGRRGAALVLVGHKWVAVLVVLVVVGGTVMVVGGTGTVVVVVVWVPRHWGAVGCEALVSVRCVCGAAVRSTESMATTAAAVTSGAATTFVAGWRITPRPSWRMAWRGGENRIRLNTPSPCERVSHVLLVHQIAPLPRPSRSRACAPKDPRGIEGLGKQSATAHAAATLPIASGPVDSVRQSRPDVAFTGPTEKGNPSRENSSRPLWGAASRRAVALTP